jgi:hypothetical protein
MMPKRDFDTIESGGVMISKRQLSNRNAREKQMR